MDDKRSEQRAWAFDHLFDAVLVTDRQGMVTDCNRAVETLYGYAPGEIIGQPVSRLQVPEDRERIATDLIRGLAENGCWSGELRMRHRDGSIGWIESRVTPLRDEAGAELGMLIVSRDISARRRNEARLARLAHHDPLTGLPNRYQLMERLQHMIDHAVRERSGFSLLYLDIDNFKEVNDRYGHAMGDRVLIHAGQCLKQALRAADTVARLGADEFVVLLDESLHSHGPEVVVEHLQAALGMPILLDKQALALHCTIAIAGYPDDGKTVDELLSWADHALYRNKSGAGRRRNS